MSAMALATSVLLLAVEAPVLKINGQAISPEAWQFLKLTRGLADDITADERRQLEEQLIERQLIRSYLELRGAEPNAELLELRVDQLESLIRRRGSEPAALYEKLGLSAEQVRRELALSVSWEGFVERSVSAQQLRSFFEDRRSEFDGTKVRVRQIFRKVTTDSDQTAAERLLQSTKDDVAKGRKSFEAAARDLSQSPSRERGGDVGWVVGLGQLPQEVARAALSLQPGQLSEPIRSPFGMHLVEVTERQQGQLSLEDARPQLLEELARQRWRELSQELRKTAKIERIEP